MAALDYCVGGNGGHLILTSVHTLRSIFLTHAFILVLGKWPTPKLDMKEMGACN